MAKLEGKNDAQSAHFTEEVAKKLKEIADKNKESAKICKEVDVKVKEVGKMIKYGSKKS